MASGCEDAPVLTWLRKFGKGMVLAIPEELDAWMLSRPPHDCDDANAQLTQLISKVARLEQENAKLRDEVRRLREGSPQSRGYREIRQLAQDSLLERCAQLLLANKDGRLDCAEAIEMARNIRALRSVQHPNDRPRFQKQIAVMLSWCAIAEVDLLSGRIEEAWRFVGKFRHICEEIQSWFNENQFADAKMTLVHEQLSHVKTRILSIESRLVT